jgi:hypothetical protein
VNQTKFIVVKIKLRENFSEFTGFLPQGLNPFKINGIFKLESVPQFITRILLRICVDPIEKGVPNISNLASRKVWIFFYCGKASFLNLQVSTKFEYWKKN